MSSRPNFLFILSDDLGWRDLSVEGSTYYESPNIDRIAREGTRFTNGYATCQVCSPSRASIMTGTYTPRHGVTDWIGAPSGDAWRALGRHNKLLPPEYEHGLRPDEVTIAEALRRAGYRTFFAGKWHLGGEGSYPEDRGFDINVGGWEAGSPKGGYFSPYQNPKLADGPAGESLPVRLARETARFMDESRGEPFFAYLSFYSVHSPIQTSKDRWEKYRLKATDTSGDDGTTRFAFDRVQPVRQVQDCPVYGGMIEAMDDAVGVVLDALDRTGLAENTVVVFTSDNGGVSSGDNYATSNLPLRGGKGRQWEGGIREPFHIRAPGLATPGSVCHVPVTGIDFYPTFLELAGVQRPPERVLDGLSLVPLLGGAAGSAGSAAGGPAEFDRDLFWHYPHYGNQGGEPSSIIRRGPWKLIHYYEDGLDELYNLDDDPGERWDLLQAAPSSTAPSALSAGTPPATVRRTDATHPGEAAQPRGDAPNPPGPAPQRDAAGARASELRSRLDAWLAEVGARFPEPDPAYDADAETERLRYMGGEFMQKLEEQHAAYLDPDWQPNEDWWGSMVIAD